MPELTVNRTLVKSPPELWSELSEVDRLANHLGEFGQIRITKVEPEETVAWEGERGSGTVQIAPSGWGTKVTLTAAVAEPVRAGPERHPAAPGWEPPRRPPPAAPKRRGLLSRLFGRRTPEAVEAEPGARPAEVLDAQRTEPPAGSVDTMPGPATSLDADRALAVLEGALDTLGAAHHRPFSRG